MRVILATDHAGFEIKEMTKKYLQEEGYTVDDYGAYTYDPVDDYPTFMHKVGKEISRLPEIKAIIYGGSGQGEAMVVNRYPKVRAIVCTSANTEVVVVGREHNDANVLSIGARFVSFEEVKLLVDAFLTTPFSAEDRHIQRINRIERQT